MNRWFLTPHRRSLLQILAFSGIAGLTGLTASSALAQSFLRQFPVQAHRGTLEITAPPVVQINGSPDRLSPGSRIHGIHNEMVMSGQLVGQQLVVNYLRNPQGQVHEIWILSAAELKADRKDRPGSGPILNFRFGSDTNPSVAADVPYNQLPKYKN